MDETRTRRLPRWFRIGLWLLRWASLIATPFFLVLCVTGSILIFHPEVDALLGDVPASSALHGKPLSVGALAAHAAVLAPGKVVQSISVSPDTPGEAFVGVVKPGPSRLQDAQILLLDRATGKPLRFTDPDNTFTGGLLKLHSQWFLSVSGEVFGSFIAILVLTALISGVVVHAPFMQRLAFGEIRKGRQERLRQLDLHNFIGTVIAGWALIVATTGLALGLGSLALAYWQSTELRAMAGPQTTQTVSPIVPVDQALATARRAMPDRDPQLIIWPNTDFSSPRHYAFLMFGTRSYNKRLFDIALVDAQTGALAAARPLPPYLQAVVVAAPLHFGDYGGLPLKLLWIASAWSTLFITANGAWLWWSKRRRGVPSPSAAYPVAAE